MKLACVRSSHCRQTLVCLCCVACRGLRQAAASLIRCFRWYRLVANAWQTPMSTFILYNNFHCCCTVVSSFAKRSCGFCYWTCSGNAERMPCAHANIAELLRSTHNLHDYHICFSCMLSCLCDQGQPRHASEVSYAV
jgi:hypothetical protein